MLSSTMPSPPPPETGHIRSGSGQSHHPMNQVEELTDSLVLRDGSVVLVRAIRSDDTARLCAFHRKLSPDTIIFRFFHYVPELALRDAEHFTQVDYEHRMALVATTGAGEAEQLLGVVRYERIGPATAEVAFVVADHWQGHGIATALLHRLAAYAREHGYSTFVAVTMGSNARMLDVLHHSGFPSTMRYAEGEVEVRLDISRAVDGRMLPGTLDPSSGKASAAS